MNGNSTAWGVLLLAGLCEIAWAVGLKYTEGFSRLVPSVLTLLAMVASVLLLGWSLKTLPLGTAFVLHSTQWLQKSSVIWLQWRWLAGEQSLAAFWWQNLGPWLLLRLRGDGSGGWGIRLAGVALAATSGWALWMGITNPTGLWCA